jgi:hypothetical protein
VDALCYNVAVTFYSWLRQNAEAIVIALILAGVVVAAPLVFAFYAPDKMLEAATLAVAIFALVLAILGFNFVRRQVETRIRPFVSVHTIESSASVSKESTHFILDSLSIHIQNTGSIPARSPRVHVCLKRADSGQIAWQDKKEMPSLAPNTRGRLTFSDLTPPEIHQDIYQGKMNLEIRVNYEGIGENYQTKQTYKIQPSGLPITAQNFTVFVFEPIEPMSFR